MRRHPTLSLAFILLCTCSPRADAPARGASARRASATIEKPFEPITKARIRARPRLRPPELLVAATATGSLCVIDPSNGSKLDSLGERAVDLIATEGADTVAVASYGDDEQPGMLSRYAWREDRLHLVEQHELDAPDTRLLHAGAFTVGLAQDMGTTLFITSGGDAVARSVPRVSGAVARESDRDLELFLLEASEQSPGLLHVIATPGTLRELGREPLNTVPMACPARLVDTGDGLLVVGTTDAYLMVATLDGSQEVRTELSPGSLRCVEAAVWLDQQDALLVLTGPVPRLDLIPWGASTPGAMVELPGTLWHDPLPRARVAVDRARQRAWVALSERLVAVDVGGGALTPWMQTEACMAEAVVVVER